MKDGLMEIKEWFLDKTEETSSRYNTWIDVERNADGTKEVVDGFVKVTVEEVLKETEKAVQVILSTGAVVGSGKGWKTWIPKSVIK